MNYKFFTERITSLFFNPEKTWNEIHTESMSVKDTIKFILLPLISLVTIAGFLGSVFFTNSQLPLIYSIFTGLKYFLLLFTVIFLSALLHREITYPLDLGRDFTISFRIIAYSMVPLFFCQMVSLIFESLVFINILSLYGLYIFWSGSEKILNPPSHKKVPMLIATTIILSVFYVATDLILSRIIDRIYYAVFG